MEGNGSEGLNGSGAVGGGRRSGEGRKDGKIYNTSDGGNRSEDEDAVRDEICDTGERGG